LFDKAWTLADIEKVLIGGAKSLSGWMLGCPAKRLRSSFRGHAHSRRLNFDEEGRFGERHHLNRGARRQILDSPKCQRTGDTLRSSWHNPSRRRSPGRRPIHLLFHPDRRQTPKLRSFIDVVVAEFGTI